jgi:regulatory protein
VWRRTKKPNRPAEEQATSPEAAFEVGIRLLGLRAHSRRELAVKLARRGFTEAAAEPALERLAGLGYLDDAAYARALVRRRASGRGRALIAAELAAKGVSREVTGAALEDLDRATQLDAATRLGRRLAGSLEFDSAAAARLVRRLLRRGFPASVAVQAVRTVSGQAAADADRID